jgi:hypothetical protein
MAVFGDLFSAHREECVKALVQELGIWLVVIPAAVTGEYQLLDLRIVGA